MEKNEGKTTSFVFKVFVEGGKKLILGPLLLQVQLMGAKLQAWEVNLSAKEKQGGFGENKVGKTSRGGEGVGLRMPWSVKKGGENRRYVPTMSIK